LKLGLAAPSGGGKTLGSLFIAYGLMKKKYPKESDAFRWSKIVIVDTENGSGQLYANMTINKVNVKVGEYNTITLQAPFEAEKYVQAIDLCEQSGMEVCIIDSSTHLWSGEGGLLEQQNSAAKRSGNSYTAWRDITPMHNKFVERMLQSNLHIIATMRSKQEYVQEAGRDGGKSTVRKLGLEPEQRKGMEYEFTCFYEINAEHEAFGSKDRTSIYDQKTFPLLPAVGETLMDWLMSSEAGEGAVVAKLEKADPKAAEITIKTEIIELCKALGGSKDDELMGIVKKYAPNGNPNSIADDEQLANLRVELLDLQTVRATAVKAD
jgi:hypothetical protein